MSEVNWENAPEDAQFIVDGKWFIKHDDGVESSYYDGQWIKGTYWSIDKYKDLGNMVDMRPAKIKLDKTGRSINNGSITASSSKSDGSTAKYYELPSGATELQHLISYRDMNSQIGEIFRSCYRFGTASHSDKLRDAKKIQFYINAEIERLEALK